VDRIVVQNEALYESLVSVDDLSELPVDEALVRIGQLVDLSMDLRRLEGLRRALQLSEELQNRSLTSGQLATSHYFLANAWSNIGRLSKAGTNRAWEWEQQELEKEMIHLRKALLKDGLSELPDERIGQILTNLGNAMDHVGRFVEAIEYWDRAVRILPSFSMARGNRGLGLVRYALLLYDHSHAMVLLGHAHADLAAALSSPIPDHARVRFEACRAGIESKMSPAELAPDSIDMDAFVLGDSENEIEYRLWCLSNRLFLNPLNDLGPRPIAARDLLVQPSIVVGIDEGPYYAGFFNQMKQEFASARYLLYDGINGVRPHFSDREVLLFNTLDYPTYCLAAEKTKAAFRMLYSLLDKIAYFLNHYLALSIPERSVKFRTLWYMSQRRSRGPRAEFQSCRNWPLRGLYWLSKDLYEAETDFRESLEPDAKELWEIRNHLEHKYLKLHTDEWGGPRSSEHETLRGLTDTLAFSRYRRDFEAKTMRLAKMVRAGLIYLSLAIHGEERRRAQERDPDAIIPGMPLAIWDDGWKF
jgi:tetratricopeptide (TPR) repeat protein